MTEAPYPGYHRGTYVGSLHPHFTGEHRYCGGGKANCDEPAAAKRAGLDWPHVGEEYERRRDAYLAARGLTYGEWITEHRHLVREEYIAGLTDAMKPIYRALYEKDDRDYEKWSADPSWKVET